MNPTSRPIIERSVQGKQASATSLSAKYEDELRKQETKTVNSDSSTTPLNLPHKSSPLHQQSTIVDASKPMQHFTITVPNLKHHGQHPSNLSADLRLFYYAVRNIENSTDLVYINGPRGKRLFDLYNTNPHLLITDKMNIRSWYNLAVMINDTVSHSIPTTKAVHVHNEMKIGDVLLILVREYCKKNRIHFPKPPEAVHIDRKVLHGMMDFNQAPMVITNTVDENWGVLSTCKYKID